MFYIAENQKCNEEQMKNPIVIERTRRKTAYFDSL
jgi:hypothetical protein